MHNTRPDDLPAVPGPSAWLGQEGLPPPAPAARGVKEELMEELDSAEPPLDYAGVQGLPRSSVGDEGAPPAAAGDGSAGTADARRADDDADLHGTLVEQ
eukprot:13969640-Alexandrium_andersonii.AAC.1